MQEYSQPPISWHAKQSQCTASQAYLMQALGNWFSAHTYMGVKAYKSEHGLRRPTKDAALLASHEAAGRTNHQSNALFSWLFKACLAYQLYEWLRVSQLPCT